MTATWTIQTPPAPGAVAIIQLAAASAADLDSVVAGLNIPPTPIGHIVLRDLLGIDRGLVARWSETSVHLMPHGGIAVLRTLARALLAAGIPEVTNPDPRTTYPEARSLIEARMLATLARAASPLGVDLLLDQPRRWTDSRAEAMTPADATRHHRLSHLIDPPLVVACGPPNIGKSSLLNALAGRNAAIVADQPGTTRDHIGIHIDMAGLLVRYIDTPGIRPTTDPIETEAASIASELMARADLLLCCGDRTAAPSSPAARPALTIATRTDLGLPTWPHDVAVSATTGRGLPELVSRIREALVPASLLADPSPWQFWD